MTPAEIEQKAAEDAILRGYHDIPDDAKLQNMSFVELAALLSSCENGSARFLVVERELARRKQEDSFSFVMPLPPDESFRRLKAVLRWLKEHVLAAIIIFVITTILGIYITKWLGSPQDQNPQPTPAAKAMPV